MAVQTYDLVIRRGDTYNVEFTWQDSDGNPIDLTGYTARMQIRAKVSSPDPPAVDVTEGAGIVLGGAAGTVTVELTPEQTGDGLQDCKSGVYDVELTSSIGTVTTIIGGRVSFIDQVTR